MYIYIYIYIKVKGVRKEHLLDMRKDHHPGDHEDLQCCSGGCWHAIATLLFFLKLSVKVCSEMCSQMCSQRCAYRTNIPMVRDSELLYINLINKNNKTIKTIIIN